MVTTSAPKIRRRLLLEELNTTTAAIGLHTLIAVARDAAGNLATAFLSPST
jgi:hypothetical protein